MATYVIGDVQGCFNALQTLLKQIQFDVNEDTLWFTGDLVNRGPLSLETIRFVEALGDKHKTVLGNHDLHLLAVAYHAQAIKKSDTLHPILNAADLETLMSWLKQRPLLYAAEGYVLTHAGLAPSWDLAKANRLAKEVEQQLQGPQFKTLLNEMYGNQPDFWDDNLQGMDRLRCIINHFTRMRYCEPDGHLNFSYKGNLQEKPAHLIPWFEMPERANRDLKLIFGHWAALGGQVSLPNLYPLDTGCVWGNALTALRLDDEKRFSVKCG